MPITKNRSCLQCSAKDCFINLNCNDEWKQKFDIAKGVNVYKKGEYIFREGFPIVGIYFVYSGKVRQVSITADGSEYVVRFAKEGHVLGHIGADNEKYSVDSVAIEDTVVCFFKNEILRDAVFQNTSLLYDLMIYYSCELRKSEIRSRNIALMNVKERIASSLLLMVNAFGKEIASGMLRLNVKISGADLANIAGTTPEEISRTMSEFKKQGIAFVEKRNFFIKDLKKLESIIDGYSHEWDCCEKAF